jgi:oligo-1,6-glucosidase
MKKLALLLLLPAFFGCQNQAPAPAKSTGTDHAWWKEGVVYQVYPRSFQDSNGDGVGDLKGIISRLDYIKSLGVDIVWLNPIYGSPNDDNGYDISDYESIMKEFGTMADFDALLKGMHDRGIKLVMDLVVNHSSDEHNWFKQSRTARNNPYRDYYHWWPAEKGTPPHRWSFFDVAGEAWKFDTTTNAYYLHYFSQKQPDLNWENPKLRQEIYKMMRNWFDKGVDGFRMDVIPFISKDTTFPVITPEYLQAHYGGPDSWDKFYGDGPHVHDYLQEMNREVLSKYDVMSVGEGAGVTLEKALQFVDSDRKELNMFFHFDGVGLGQLDQKSMDPNGWKLTDFKRIYSKWSDVFAQKGWGSIYLGNHDQPRMLSRWGSDEPEFRDPASKMLQTFLLSMRATAYIYNGDEIGMSNIRFNDINDYRDIETLNWYKLLKNKGENMDRYMEGWKITARDNGRTPFQWNTTANAGFTTGTPWLKINPNYATINAEAQEKDPKSILNYFRSLIQYRKAHPILVYGAYELLSPDDPSIYAYTRSMDGKKLLVLLNFSKQTVAYTIPDGIKPDAAQINNYDQLDLKGNVATLKPFQAVILAVQ